MLIIFYIYFYIKVNLISYCCKYSNNNGDDYYLFDFHIYNYCYYNKNY